MGLVRVFLLDLLGLLGLLIAMAAGPSVLAQSSAVEEAASPSPAPRVAAPYVNRNLVFLDPAHGGQDTGAHIGSSVLEKDVNLALAARVRASLAANNVGVLMSREADANDLTATTLTSAQVADNRAGMANHARPVACVVFHATSAGSGVHVLVSPLAQAEPGGGPIAWDAAQATFAGQSERLANSIGMSLRNAGVPVRLTRASVRPLDNLLCPAVVVEVAPLPGSPATAASDAAYEGRVGDAVGAALVAWHRGAEADAAAAKAAAAQAAASGTTAAPRALPTAPAASGAAAGARPPSARPSSSGNAAPSGSAPRSGLGSGAGSGAAAPRAPRLRPIPEPAEPLPPRAPIIRQPPAAPAAPAPIIRRPPPSSAPPAGAPPGEAGE